MMDGCHALILIVRLKSTHLHFERIFFQRCITPSLMLFQQSAQRTPSKFHQHSFRNVLRNKFYSYNNRLHPGKIIWLFSNLLFLVASIPSCSPAFCNLNPSTGLYFIAFQSQFWKSFVLFSLLIVQVNLLCS